MFRTCTSLCVALLVLGSGQLTGDELFPHLAYKAAMQSAEKRILTALNQKVDVDFNNTPLREVVQFFGKELNVPFYLDADELGGDGITTDELITFNGKGLAARSAIDLLFAKFGLAWVMHNELLHITTASDAESRLKTVVYDVTDLINLVDDSQVKPPPFHGTGFGFGEGQPAHEFSRENKKAGKGSLVGDVDPLIELIMNETTGPWVDLDGISGAIRDYEHTKKGKRILVIRQTQKVHLEIEELLHDMRTIIHEKE